MNKTLKGIFAGCGVLVVLGGAFAVLKLTESPEQGDSSSESSEDLSVELWNIPDSDSINQISVEPAEGESFVAYRKMEMTTEKDSNTGESSEVEVANYYLKGYDDLPMNTTQIRTLASRSSTLSAVATIEENAPESDLSQYGLDSPVKVTFSVDDADSVVFYIGKETPVSTYTYLRMEGSNTVYTVESLAMEPFLTPIQDYLGTNVTEEQAEDDDTIVESVRIERKDLDYDFYFIYDPYYEENSNGGMLAQQIMVEPIPCILSPDRSGDATHGLYGLTAAEVLYPHPDAAKKTECGLDDPFVRVTMVTDDGKTTVFLLGDSYTDEDSQSKRYYGYLEGIDCIYGFAEDAIIYDNMRPQDVASSTVISYYVWDIGKLTYSAGDLSLKFEGKGTDQKDFVLSLNGKSLSEDEIERYRLLYTYLLDTSAEELVLEDVKPEGEPMAEVTIERQDGKRKTELKFYEANSMQAYIEVDGRVNFLCRKSYVQTLIHNMEIFEQSDQDFTMVW